MHNSLTYESLNEKIGYAKIQKGIVLININSLTLDLSVIFVFHRQLNFQIDPTQTKVDHANVSSSLRLLFLKDKIINTWLTI